MRRRPLWLALLWSVVAATATTVAYAAITAVGSGLTPASDAAALQVSATPTVGLGAATAGGQAPVALATSGPGSLTDRGAARPPRPRDRIDKDRFRRLDDGAVGARGPGRSASYSTVGGTVVARCRAEAVTLTAWSPAQGFRVAQVSRGPADGAEITFVSNASQVDLQVECRGGRPVFSVEAETADD